MVSSGEATRLLGLLARLQGGVTGQGQSVSQISDGGWP